MTQPKSYPRCDNCDRPFATARTAPHKRFCGPSCRLAWHARRRKAAYEALARSESEAEARAYDDFASLSGKTS